MAEGLKQLFVYEHDASRLELFIRIVYAFVVLLVLAVYGLVAEICMVIQWFVILILGRRSEGLSNFIKGYLEYAVHIMSYVYWMTDDRPGIFPKPVEIHEKE
jgi:amino acid permease